MSERSSHFPRSISLNLGQSASKPRDDGTTLQKTSGSGPIRGNLDIGARGGEEAQKEKRTTMSSPLELSRTGEVYPRSSRYSGSLIMG